MKKENAIAMYRRFQYLRRKFAKCWHDHDRLDERERKLYARALAEKTLGRKTLKVKHL